MQDTIEIEGYEALLERERRNRVFGAVATCYYVCGVAVRPLTPRVITEMRAFDHPFLCGGVETREACVTLLWRLFVGYRDPHDMTLRSRWHRFLLGYKLRRMTEARLVRAVREFIAIQTQDMPRSDPRAGGEAAGESVEKEAAATAIHNGCEFIRVFGGTMQQYLDTPIAVLNQMWRWHQADIGSKDAIRNKSDEVREEAVMAAISQQEIDNATQGN